VFAGDFWPALLAAGRNGGAPIIAPAPDIGAADESWLDRVADGFAAVIDAKSPFTAAHSRRVARLADAIAARMGLDGVQRRDLHRAALLHDIGKLSVSNRILDKPGRLDDDELRLVREHPRHTAAILSHVRGFETIAADAAAHHERLDGSGYPDGLPKDRLSSAARILAVADVFEALTSERPYRGALSRGEALAHVRGEAGLGLCPDAVAALAASLDAGADALG
jgi:putative nucleotidyltransferase with HDIG domain